MFVSICYAGTLCYYGWLSLNHYRETKAPVHIKTLRNVLSLLTFGHYFYLGFFTISALGERALLDFFLGEDVGALLKLLPNPFVVSFLALELLKTAYQLWKTLIQDSDVSVKAKDISLQLINACLLLALGLSAASILSPALFPSLMCGYAAFKIASHAIERLFVLFDKMRHDLAIDWSLVITEAYLSLLAIILTTGRALQIIAFGGVLFDSFLCLQAGIYLALKSAVNFYYEPKISAQLLLQLGLSLGQFMLGALLISGAVVVPHNPILSLFILGAIKNTIFLPLCGSIKNEIEEDAQVSKEHRNIEKRRKLLPKDSCHHFMQRKEDLTAARIKVHRERIHNRSGFFPPAAQLPPSPSVPKKSPSSFVRNFNSL